MLLKIYTKLSALIVIVSFYSVSLSAQSETEPNNTTAQANVLPVNDTISGALNVAGDVDWYKVTTISDGQINLAFDNSGNPDLKTVTLFDNDGVTSLASSNVGNGIGGLNYNGVAAGTYFIKINGPNGTETGAYKLYDSLLVPALANDAEPNGNISQAVILNVNDSTTGHLGYYYKNQRDTSDWYKITTNADGQLDITFDNSGNPDLKTLNLFDTTGNPLLSSANIGNGVGGLSASGLAAGTYFIQVTGGAGGSYNDFGPYKLKDSLEVPAKPNDTEPNNNITQSVRLNVNDSTTGHLGYYYKNRRDTSDLYKITTNADGQLDITFDNSGNPDLKTLNLFDTTGNPLLSSANIGNGVGGLTASGLAAGTYYIQITGGAGGSYNDFGPYQLKDSLEVPARPNDTEPNNTFSQALTLMVNDTTDGHIGYYFASKRDTSDWYKITTASKGRLQITFDNSGNADLETVNLYDGSGTNLITGSNVGNGIGGFESDTLAPGVYYVQITGGAGGSFNDFGPYKLSDTLFTALPVTLVNFDGRLSNNQAVLSWSTQSENNNKGFDVERSTDGHSFSAIGFVPGNGTSSLVHNYTWSDVKVVSGSNYYRLKQYDLDNNFNYSSVIRLDYVKFGWSILGNPVVANNAWIQLQLDKKAPVTVQVVSIDGNILHTINKGILSAGTYSIPLSLGNAAKGIYVVKLSIGDKSFVKRVVR